MKLIRNNMDFKLNNSIVTLGKFDGFHRGHMKLVNRLTEEKNNLDTVVFTFSASPEGRTKSYKGEILSHSEREYMYDKLGVDYVIEYPFTNDVMHMKPETFIEKVISGNMSAKKIVVGPDYRFGYNRLGDISLLRKLSDKYGYEVEAVDKVRYEDEVISSTRIRDCIVRGDVRKAAQMLGYQYFVYGEVVHGEQIGRTISLPTINQIPDDNKVLPPNGVYATVVSIDGKKHYGITNVGCKPTVKADFSKTVETFIFDFDEDVYGKRAYVEFYKFIRPETKFNGIYELKAQIMNDIEEIKKDINGIFG